MISVNKKLKGLLLGHSGRTRTLRARRKVAFSWMAEPMEPRLVPSSVVQPLRDGIDFAQDPGRRISSIRVDGQELLKSGGIYLIASRSGADTPETNFESILADSGRMRNHRGEYGPRFTLSFAKQDANTIAFKMKVGPVGKDFNQFSLAMDFQKEQVRRFEVPNADRMKFSSRAPGDDNWYREGGRFNFSDIQQNMAIKNARGVVLGHVGTALTRNPVSMSEFNLVGPRVVVTVRITKAENVKTLSFANHFVSNTAGFGFGEPLRRGETATLEGEINIRRR